MRLEIWIIAVMIFLVGGVLALIAAAPDEIAVPTSEQQTPVKISDSVSMSKSTSSMSAPGSEDVVEIIVSDEPESIVEEHVVELKESVSIVEPKIEQASDEPTELASPLSVEVGVAIGSGVPGCEETNECYIPAEVTIAVGGQVTWNNDDSAAHTVTSGNPADGPDGIFDSSLFMSGTTFEHTFDKSGTFEYFCMVHPWMIGTIQVS